MRKIEDVRRAKDRLRELVKDRPWYRGVGIANADGDLVLRLNVATDADELDVPREQDGIPVDVVRTDGYAART